MARFGRVDVYLKMKETGLVPLFYHPDVVLGQKVLEACYKGGARILEFTNRGDFAHKVFDELHTYAIEELPELIMGVGSVTDAATASLYMQLGANFVVTPLLREDIALVCNRKKVMFSPGCGTLAEIARAEELGCEVVKLFPGGTYGPGFVKAIKGPCPWTEIMPTGGVSPDKENLSAWFGAGVTCVGMGSNLITKQFLADRDFDGLQKLVTSTLQTIKDIRS
jgi:2-dehydro-3-deoxyphosphogluconate aldolase/(4S)-4-hydroxy-2-oxoglutarate aldolase